MNNFELNITSPPKSNNSKKGTFKKNGHRKYLMSFEIREIILLYPDKFNWQLAKQYNVSESTILRIKRIHNLKKSEQIMDAMRFKKGHKSFNKGKHHIHSSATKFKVGHIPNNYKPVGSKRLTKDGYYEIKIAEPNIWEAFHRMVWQDINGEIPEGMIVVFKDDKLNCDISNLEMITREENLIRNRNRTKAANSMRERWKSERLRFKYGLPQKTRLRVK